MKIYLSKSNAANPVAYSSLKSKLLKDGHSIVEWSQYGGDELNRQNLITSDMLLVLPPASTMEQSNKDCDWQNRIKIGRGQYEQIKRFVEETDQTSDWNDNGDLIDFQIPYPKKLAVVRYVAGEVIACDELFRMEYLGQDWTQNYAELWMYAINDVEIPKVEKSRIYERMNPDGTCSFVEEDLDEEDFEEDQQDESKLMLATAMLFQ